MMSATPSSSSCAGISMAAKARPVDASQPLIASQRRAPAHSLDDTGSGLAYERGTTPAHARSRNGHAPPARSHPSDSPLAAKAGGGLPDMGSLAAYAGLSDPSRGLCAGCKRTAPPPWNGASSMAPEAPYVIGVPLGG